MIGRLCHRMCHWRASSLLFRPNGCNVLALFIKWASPAAFLIESRLLRMSSIGMRRTSLIEWLVWSVKCSDTGVVVLSCWWFRILRASVFPKAFIVEWTLVLSTVLKVALFAFYQVYGIFWVARYGVGDFSSFVSCRKSIVKEPVQCYM